MTNWAPDGFVHLFESPELKLRSQQNTTHVDYMNIWYTLHTYVYNTLQYRLLSEALVLTGADICSAVKPWDVQYPTAMDVFSEYHDQVIPLISHLVSQKKLPFFGSTNFYVSFPKTWVYWCFLDQTGAQGRPNQMGLCECEKEVRRMRELDIKHGEGSRESLRDKFKRELGEPCLVGACFCSETPADWLT